MLAEEDSERSSEQEGMNSLDDVDRNDNDSRNEIISYPVKFKGKKPSLNLMTPVL